MPAKTRHIGLEKEDILTLPLQYIFSGTLSISETADEVYLPF